MIAKKDIQIEGHKLMYHPNEVSRWINGQIFAPIYLEIGPTNICNHKCNFCALDYLEVKPKFLDKKVFLTNLEDMGNFGVKAIMFAGEGEPLMHKQLPEAIKQAKNSAIDISITTNGVLFDRTKTEETLKYLSWIKFSIDAGSKETYSKVHGCKEQDFDKTLENLKFASQYKKDNNLEVVVGAQMLLLPENIHEVEDLILKIKDFDINYLILKPYSQHPNSLNQKPPPLTQYNLRLKAISAKYSKGKFPIVYRSISAKEVNVDKIEYNECYGLNFFALIDALGNVIPCNIFYGKEEYYYGNINKNKFSDIWKSEQRKKVLERLYKEGTTNCRKGCRLNYINQYLDNLKNKKVEHINFI